MANGILDIYDLEKSTSQALFVKFVTGTFKEWLKASSVKIAMEPNYSHPRYSFKVEINNYFELSPSDYRYRIYVVAEEKDKRNHSNHSVKINAGFAGQERKVACFADYPVEEGFSPSGSEIAKSVYEMTVRKYKAQQKQKAALQR
jgi:hypothetical protein